MIAFKTSFTRRELLWFGPLFALFAGMVGGLAWFKFEVPSVAKGIWIIAVSVIALYYAVPPLRRALFMAWLGAVYPLGWLLSHLLLGIVFYLVVFPIGLIAKVFRYDALRRRPDSRAASYWIEREPHPDPRNYFRQF